MEAVGLETQSDVAGFNIDSEIDYFLGEAMASAKVVGDKVVDNLAANTDVRDAKMQA